MKLSELQKYILLKALSANKKISRAGFIEFYNKRKKKPKKEDRAGIISKSIERLINKELLVGYGTRTPHKWFIKEISLTGKGKKTAKKLLGEQQKLPLKK